LECCVKKGKTSLSDIYKDFGDVRDDDFKAWWDSHGVALFGERPSTINLKELLSKEEWDDNWTSDDVMVVCVPLARTKRDLGTLFGALLKKRHGGKRGRTAKKFNKSTSLYPLSRDFSTRSMRIALKVFDTYTAAKKLGEKKTLWQIGNDLRISPSNVIKPNEALDQITNKQNILAVTVKRYLNQAEKAIRNSALGTFP